MRTAINRRAMLGAGSSLTILGAVGMPASPVLPAGASATVPLPQSAELHRLIEASRSAEAAWWDAEDAADVDRGHDEVAKQHLRAEAERSGGAAQAALLALLAYRPGSLDELRTMIAFLREPRGPWDAPERITFDEVTILLDAIVTGRG